MREDPKPGELYRHFKDRLYQVLCTARDSETGERVVVYQALYGDYGVWVRPLDMFLSEVDHQKYPDVAQKWRFEKVARGTEQTSAADAGFPGAAPCSASFGAEASSGSGAAVPNRENASAAGSVSAGRENASAAGSVSAGRNAAPDGPSEVLLAFLDTDDLELKRGVLLSNAERITQRDLDSILTVCGINPPGGSLQEQLDVILDWLSLHERYESDRPRGRNEFHV